jgi:hypothetical protein
MESSEILGEGFRRLPQEWLIIRPYER